MGRIFARHFGWGLLANLIVAAIGLIITLIVMLIFGGFTGPAFPAIAGIVVGAFFGIGGSIFLVGFNKPYLELLSVGKYQKAWHELIVEKQCKIGFGSVFLRLAWFLLIAVAFFIGGIILFQKMVSAEGLYLCLPTALLFNCAVLWFSYFIALCTHYGKSRCKCGVMCCMYLRQENYQTHHSTDTKVQNSYGKIGDVYEGNRKVGEVKGYTGSYTKQRDRKTSYWTSVCRCVFCGKEKKFQEYDSMITQNWH